MLPDVPRGLHERVRNGDNHAKSNASTGLNTGGNLHAYVKRSSPTLTPVGNGVKSGRKKAVGGDKKFSERAFPSRCFNNIRQYMSYKIEWCWVRLVIEIINRPIFDGSCQAVIQNGLLKRWPIIRWITHPAFRFVRTSTGVLPCHKNDESLLSRGHCSVRGPDERNSGAKIELKRIAAQSTQQHGVVWFRVRPTWYWTKWAVAVGVVVLQYSLL